MTCARCHRKAPAHEMIFSAFTKLHYCADHFACDRRMVRRLRELARKEGVTA